MPRTLLPLKGNALCLLTAVLLNVFAPTMSLAQDDDDFFIFDEEEEEIVEIADPLESLNRLTFAFNDKLYRGFLKPIAVGYRVVPEPARISIANVFANLETPVSGINALLQLDFPNAATEFSRFVLNSTIGIFGLFDPASRMGIEEDNEDFGQTLAHYGVGHGAYLVLPLFGASSVRDGLGLLGNYQISPVLQEWDPDAPEYLAYRLLQAETALSLDEDTYEAFYQGALDPYVFFRSAYGQNRDGDVIE